MSLLVKAARGRRDVVTVTPESPRLIEPSSMRHTVRGKELNTRYVTDILPEDQPA